MGRLKAKTIRRKRAQYHDYVIKEQKRQYNEALQRSIARNSNLNQPNIAASFTKSFQGEDTGCMNEDGAFSPDYHSRTR